MEKQQYQFKKPNKLSTDKGIRKHSKIVTSSDWPCKGQGQLTHGDLVIVMQIQPRKGEMHLVGLGGRLPGGRFRLDLYGFFLLVQNLCIQLFASVLSKKSFRVDVCASI